MARATDERATFPALAPRARAPRAAARRGPAYEPPRPPPRPRGTPFNGYAVVLTVVMTLTFLMFLLIEPTPRWVLLVGTIVAIMGIDGTLRATWPSVFRVPDRRDLAPDAFSHGDPGAATGSAIHPGSPGTVPYLFLPALYALAAPLLAEHNAPGHWVVVAGLAAGAGFGALVYAELASVRPHGADYGLGRQLASALASSVAFALYSLTYVLDADVPGAMLAVGLVSGMIAVELYREGEIDPAETLIFAAVTGIVLAELRWVFYFIPLDGYLAGLTLLLAFFFLSGVVHSHLTRRLDVIVAAEFAIIALTGVALVVAARLYGLA